MKRFARALVVVLGLVVLGSVVSLVPQKNVTAQSGPTVTIGSPLPLPVKGSVNATVSGTVAAQQSGSWSVGLAPNTTVGISGTPTVNAVGTTTILDHEFETSTNTDPANNPIVGPVDTSGMKTVRVTVSSSTCILCSNVTVSVLDDNFVVIDTIPLPVLSSASRVYEIPAKQLRLSFANAGAGANNSTQVTVLGRSN